jgi:uncharacterized membrane protein YgdD (TMEM256/DUF423 family)
MTFSSGPHRVGTASLWRARSNLSRSRSMPITRDDPSGVYNFFMRDEHPPKLEAARGAAAGGALLGALGVAAGAFGAHALRAVLAPDMLAIYETAVRYQLWHALALFAAAWSIRQWPGPWSRSGAALLGAGTVLFSGSLYALAFGAARLVGAITPLGGLLLLSGWLALALAPLRARA